MKKRNIGFLYLLFGFIFLASPDLSIFDFLPDFIGYILLLAGLEKLADIDERAFDARRLAKRLFVLSCVKCAFSFYLASLHKTNLLLVTFSIAILNLILIIPFLKELFHSLDYTATRQGIMLNQKKISEYHTVSVLFFVLKDVFMVLPSVISLFDPAETGNFDSNLWYIDFTALSNVLTVLSFFFMTLLGIFMMVKTVMFFSYLLKNRELCEKLYENYERSVLLVPSRLISKGVRQTSHLIIAAFFFFVDFYVDFIDVLPSAIGFFLVLVFSLSIEKKLKIKTLALTVVSALGTLFSLVAFLYRLFWQKKLGAAIEYAFSEKTYTLALSVLYFVFVFLTLVLAYKAISGMGMVYADFPCKSRVVLLGAMAAILCFFIFLLFAYPEKNASFVFPNILFSCAFVFVSYDFVKAVSAEVLNKNKDI